jgi:putative endonuclease
LAQVLHLKAFILGIQFLFCDICITKLQNIQRKMATHNLTGQQGELLAAQYLQRQGYQIIERNYRFGRYEIDIIAQKENFLIIVEVKTKTNLSYGSPADEVTPKKAAQVANAAVEYMYQNQWKGEVRYDIIAVVLNGPKATIEHIKDAF